MCLKAKANEWNESVRWLLALTDTGLAYHFTGGNLSDCPCVQLPYSSLTGLEDRKFVSLNALSGSKGNV